MVYKYENSEEIKGKNDNKKKPKLLVLRSDRKRTLR